MVPVGSSVMLELVLAVHCYRVIAYPGIALPRRRNKINIQAVNQQSIEQSVTTNRLISHALGITEGWERSIQTSISQHRSG